MNAGEFLHNQIQTSQGATGFRGQQVYVACEGDERMDIIFGFGDGRPAIVVTVSPGVDEGELSVSVSGFNSDAQPAELTQVSWGTTALFTVRG